MKLALCLLPAAAVPLAAQEGPQPVLAQSERIEAELRADLDADGIADHAYVAATDETRELRVVTSATGKSLAQVLKLTPGPLGDAMIKLDGNVLLFQDLNGGTTAVFSTHRFRWDKKLGAMRLIGLDATFYSRTFAHDGREASWNLLTGDLHTHTMRLRNDDSDVAYDEIDKRQRRKKSKPVRLEKSPSGDDLLGWPCGRS